MARFSDSKILNPIKNIVTSESIYTKLIKEEAVNTINSKVKHFCNHNGFHFINNSNICIKDFCTDDFCLRLHVNDKNLHFRNIYDFLEDLSKQKRVLLIEKLNFAKISNFGGLLTLKNDGHLWLKTSKKKERR